jgi:flagellar assembly factor FliW
MTESTAAKQQAPPNLAALPEERLRGITFSFPTGIPGFPLAREFVFEPVEGLSPFMRMVCLNQDNLAFIVVPPGRFFPDYTIEVAEADAERLGLKRPEDAVVLVVVTARKGEEPTANLLGPLVLNPALGRGAQVVQHQSNFDARTPIRPTAPVARA